MGTARDLNREARVEASERWLSRYEPLLDDPGAFWTALEQPPPVDLLIPPHRGTTAQIAELFRSRGVDVEPFDAAPHHLRLPSGDLQGPIPEVQLGFVHRQGVSSALPVLALAPRAGERLLDLCAAPGGKSVYAAALAGDAARVVALDASFGRSGPLALNLTRQALTSAAVFVADSASLPMPGVVDAILLDAPCSGEGTYRRPVPRFEPRGALQLQQAPPIQLRLLARALDLLRPGGRLVYSTCAFAPEENEAVIDQILSSRDDVRLLPLPNRFPGLPGIGKWDGVSFDRSLRLARRILPHHLGSWGFFIALLEKSPDSIRLARRKRPPPSEPQLPHDPDAERLARDLFVDHYGAPAELLDQHDTIRRGRDIWLRRRLPADVSDLACDGLKLVIPGLRAIHLTKSGPRATSSGLRWAGSSIRREVLELPYQAACEWLRRGEIDPPPGVGRRPLALRVADQVVGAITVEAGVTLFHLPSGWR